MGKQPKPYESPLSPQLAKDILNIPIEPGQDVKVPRTIGERVHMAIEAIEEANRHLAASPVSKIVARSIMQELKKRGEAIIAVRPDGTVVLRVTYGEDSEEVEETRLRRDAPMVQTTHKSGLPYLDALREEAKELGVDISHLGRQRRAINEFLDTYKQNLKVGFDEVRVSALPLPLPKRGQPTNGLGKHHEEKPTPVDDLSDLLDVVGTKSSR